MTDDSQHAHTDPSEVEAPRAPSSRARRMRIAVLVALAVLPLALTALAQPLLPDTVPLHYTASGTPDEWGSKARLFVTAGILTTIDLAVTWIYAVVARQQETGRADWLIVEGKMSFPAVAVVFVAMALAQSAYVLLCFHLTDTGFLLLR